ncbi:unnamed protein product [Moneuplotes crassus]|uniref:Uncharacterized protein n=1 Tax=Euplotes crassus TaxID=5936 RepID=A0AAD1UFX7_EUPCR|nr:unnamed protein product [Moneuplotes crassus]
MALKLKSVYVKERGLGSLETQELEKDETEGLLRKDDKGEVSAKVWMTLSLLVGFFYAVGNICMSYLARFGIMVAGIQGIGGLFGNLIPLIILSVHIRHKKTPLRSDSVDIIQNPWYKWFHDIYFVREQDEQGRIIENKWKNKVRWDRIFTTFIITLITVIYIMLFFMSYYLGTIGNINSGILNALSISRAIVTSIMFYFMFQQALEWYETLCVLLMTVSVVTIVVSGDNIQVTAGRTAQFYVALSCILLVISLSLLSVRAAVLKYMFGASKEVNFSALFNFANVVMEVGFCVYFGVLLYWGWLEGLGFTWFELGVGIFGGLLYSLSNYIVAYVNVRGKAGVADCLIEIKTILQTIMDVIIFGRFPNLMQHIGLTLGLLSVVFLLLFAHLKSKKTSLSKNY